MSLEFYPQNYSEKRPFFVEIKIENDKKSFQLFKANYFYSESEWEKMDKDPLMSNECHPWNLGLEGELIDFKYPNSASFWREDFVKFMILALNDLYEKQNNKK